jgi:hypothetical protein
MIESGIGIGWRRNACSLCWRRQPSEIWGRLKGMQVEPRALPVDARL